jgi:hypothetical protein
MSFCLLPVTYVTSMEPGHFVSQCDLVHMRFHVHLLFSPSSLIILLLLQLPRIGSRGKALPTLSIIFYETVSDSAPATNK